MEKLKEMSGNIVLKSCKGEAVFDETVFEMTSINAGGRNVMFSDCTFYNDFTLINCGYVAFKNCTFVFDTEEKKTGIKVFSHEINLDQVYVNDLKGDSVVKFNADYFSAFKFVYDSTNPMGSFLDVISDCYSFDKCAIDAKKMYLSKHDDSFVDNIPKVKSKKRK